ncbi:AAA family ATPase [Glycomyces mayteni]|uniref:AAA family ATPase n=1 Tax=Glycomyces mayteni TaxID=543887 RepID=A0ABW2DF54_9ACTN|nr:hypothetical protein GCM10025732_06120 [Glycomyces mayteni]
MSSSTPDENAHNNNTPDPDANAPDRTAFLASMREGVSGSMARLRASLHKAAHPTLTALICASACAPVIAAAAGAGLTLTAALALLGSVGGNAVSEFIGDRLARLKGRDAPAAEAALAEAFSEVLQSDSPDTAEVRRALAALLEQTGAFTIVIGEAARDDDSELLEAVRAEFEHLAGLSEENHRLLLEQGARILDLCRDHAASLSLQTTVRDTAQETLGVLVQLFQFVQYVAATPGAEHGTTRWDGNPYLGLQPFTTSDAPIFFGRTATLAQLVAAAEAFVPGGSMIVTGPSGVGKSSLLRAGFAPAVEHGLFREDPRQGPWRTVLLERPGERPLTALAAELAKHGGPDSTTTEQSLRTGPEAAAARVEERRNGPDGARPERLLILLDQAEELFTLANEEERTLFLRALESIAKSPGAFTVLGIRSDHIDDCMAVPSLRDTAQHRLFRVGPMTRDQMRQAITLPAAAAGVRIDDRVVATLLEDLFGTKDTPRSPGAALPLMSQTMLLLWNHGRADRRLTEAEYLAIGGVHRAVTTAAEAAYNTLTESERITSQHLFRRLVGAESADRLVRTEVAADSLTDAERAVARTFLDARLLVADAATVQIAHDILLEQWDRLKKWMEPDLTARILLTRLEAAADQRKQGTGDLYSAASLAAIATDGEPRWAALRLAPTKDAAEFLQQSRANARRADRDRRIRLATLSALAVIAMLIGLYTIFQNGELTDERNRAVSQRLAADSIALLGTDGEQARLLAAAAWNLSETDDAYEALIRSANDTSTGLVTTDTLDSIIDLAVSPDGAWAASIGFGGSIELWNTENWTSVHLASDGLYLLNASALEFSLDGRMLAAATESGIIIWDTATAEQVAGFITLAEGDLAFSPDGKKFAVLAKGAVELWELPTQGMVTELPSTEDISALAFTNDGDSLLVSGIDAGLREWNLATDELSEVQVPPSSWIDQMWVSPESSNEMLGCFEQQCMSRPQEGQWEPIESAQWSATYAIAPDGSGIANYDSGGLSVWDAETDSWSFTSLPETDVKRLVLFPEGHTAAAATSAGIQVWNLTSPATTGSRPESVESVTTAAASDRVVLHSLDGTAVWDFPDTLLRQLDDEGDATVFTPIHLSANGSVAGGKGLVNGQSAVQLWEADTGARLPAPDGHGKLFEQIALSPDGARLAAVVRIDDTSVIQTDELWIWDRSSGEAILSAAKSSEDISALAFSPDGTAVVTAEASGEVKFRSSTDGRTIDTLASGDSSLYNLTFSANGRYLAANGNAGPRLWDLETGESRSAEAVPATAGIAFSPDGKFLVLSDDLGLSVWDLERDQVVRQVFFERAGDFAGFRSDSWNLIGLNVQRLVVHDLSFLTDPYQTVCERTDRGLTREEWDEYLGEFEFEEFEVCG